ncbi:MAG TPA: zf-HC2 domain-containing protein [Gaiellaceae bacterium]|nr:zf-HC2 domain-containing protein [Gaiellaceae bacterium]
MAEPRGEHEHGYTCKEVVELAADYVEGAMPPDLTTRFELHLNFCDGCFTFIDQIRATAAVAGRLAEEEVPEETRAKLLAAFRDWKAG